MLRSGLLTSLPRCWDTLHTGTQTSFDKPARDNALTKRNIRAGWAATGLFPFNPERVFRDTPRPPAQLFALRADEIEVVSSTQDEVPQTPVTLVIAEALIPLHNLIKQDARTLDELSQQRLLTSVVDRWWGHTRCYTTCCT
ncbi:hypothetical protein PMIN01_08180 [Paraphaeosphaeria minitans]|uniref:Uncharacterized protein n=1 Tax=Paraphaeosphaeria minitans TaxID=565426 RepID=A0A9P6KP90_9PLEO|nr:hypothetical protein PMIN01_08180 [Paraphaeosphaeria minitans]